jgi:hypothetical protein
MLFQLTTRERSALIVLGALFLIGLVGLLVI